jgi:hypothetical protein
MKSFFTVFSAVKPKKKVPKAEISLNVLHSIVICLDYLSNIKGARGIYEKIDNNKECQGLVDSIMSDTFSTNSIRSIFDPFIIASCVCLVLAKYAPIFTYSISKDITTDDGSNLPEIVLNIPENKRQFLKKLFYHFDAMISRGLSSQDDIMASFGNILIELGPKDSIPDEANVCINSLRQIYSDWHNLFNASTQPQPSSAVPAPQEPPPTPLQDPSPDQSSYSLQDRSLKVTFPKADDDNMLSERDFSHVMSKFGEVTNVLLYSPLPSSSLLISLLCSIPSPLSYLLCRLGGGRNSLWYALQKSSVLVNSWMVGRMPCQRDIR